MIPKPAGAIVLSGNWNKLELSAFSGAAPSPRRPPRHVRT